jgi:ADP-ribose pyrophosphatase
MSIGIEQAFHHCPRCANRHPEPGKIPFRCPECDFTLFFGPVAAVGGLIVDDEQRLLLVRRARDPGKGKWGLPGGFVDRGETIEEALLREIEEETALKISELDLLVTFPNRYNYRGVVSPVIDLFYVCQARRTDNIQLEPAELDEFCWATPTTKHLETMAFPSNRRAIEYWIKRGRPDPHSDRI